MKLDSKALIARLKPKTEAGARGPVTVYLDKALFKLFRKHCDEQGVSASRLLEEFMREVVGSKK